MLKSNLIHPLVFQQFLEDYTKDLVGVMTPILMGKEVDKETRAELEKVLITSFKEAYNENLVNGVYEELVKGSALLYKDLSKN